MAAVAVVTGVAGFAFAERAARVSTEEALLKAVEDRLAAQHAAAKADEERDSALRSAIEANDSRAAAEAAVSEADKAKADAEGRASEAKDAAARAEDARAIAEEKALESERERNEALMRTAVAQEGQAAAEAFAEEERQARRVAQQAAAGFEQQMIGERTANEELKLEIGIQKERTEAEAKARVLQLARTQPLIQAIVTGELKFYFEPLPRYAGEGIADAVKEVAESFSSHSWYFSTVKQVYDPQEADLTVSWVRDYGTHVLGESIFRAHIMVGLGRTNCAGEWMAFDGDTITKTLWHELGHSVGYGHSSDQNNIMYEFGETQFAVDQEISEVVSGGWYHTVPICGPGDYYYSFETENLNQGFDIFVLRPEADPESAIRRQSGVYADCGRRAMQRYSDTCTVLRGSSVLIYNDSRDAIRLTGRIIDRNEIRWPEMKWDEKVFRYDDALLKEFYELFN